MKTHEIDTKFDIGAEVHVLSGNRHRAGVVAEIKVRIRECYDVGSGVNRFIDVTYAVSPYDGAEGELIEGDECRAFADLESLRKSIV